jgi:hypothetical protein
MFSFTAPVISLLVWTFLLGAVVVVAKVTGVEPKLCTFRILSGLPCPSCGATRGVLRLLEGDIPGGFLMNPLVMITLLVLGIGFALRLAFSLKVVWNFTPRERWIFGALVVVAVLANWAWVIRYHLAI